MLATILEYLQHVSKYKNEMAFVFLFVSSTTINKYVLSELKFTVPTVFQGWQTLSCVILLSMLIKLKKIKNDLQILDSRAMYLLIPVLVCFTFEIIASSKALADLPVPVFLAIKNLYPATLIFLVKKPETNVNVPLRVCGSVAVVGTVFIILIFSLSQNIASPLFWLFGNIFLSTIDYLYLNKLNLDLSYITLLYYRNFFSIIILLPISLYLDVLHLPGNSGWEFYGGCFLSGIFGTLLQICTYKVFTKQNYLQFEGLAKVISTIIAYKVFLTELQPVVWVLVVLNFLICAAFLKNTEDENINVKSQIALSIPYMCVNKMESDTVPLV